MRGLLWGVWCATCVVSGCNFEDGVVDDSSPQNTQDQGTQVRDDMATSLLDMNGEVDADMRGALDMGTPASDMSLSDQARAPDQAADMSGAPDMMLDQGGGMAVCGNGVVEVGELCDGNCPVSCDDADVCTSDVRAGQDVTCNVICANPVISMCTSGDSCCPQGCVYAQDQDCPPPEGPDCASDATWSSTWRSVELQSQQQVNMSRTSGQCSSMMYAPRAAFAPSQPLTRAARCMAIWKKSNPNASGNQLLSQLLVEIAAAGYAGAGVSLIGGGGMSVSSAQSQLTATSRNCMDVSSPAFVQIGVGYVDGTVGNNDHVVMVVLGE